MSESSETTQSVALLAATPSSATSEPIKVTGSGADETGEVGSLEGAVMKSLKGLQRLLGKVLRDERGGEVIEYALISGLIVVAAIAVIGSVGTKVLARWTPLDWSLRDRAVVAGVVVV